MTSIKDLTAGLFVLVALLLFLVFLIWAGDLAALWTERDRVTMLLKRSVPVTAGAPVRYEGLLVGDVERVRLRTDAERDAAHADYHLALDLRLTPGTPVTKSTPAFVTADGLLGARFVDLRASTTGAPRLGDGDVLLGVLGGVDSILGRMDELTESLSLLLNRVGTLLDPDGGARSVPQLVERTTALVDGFETTRKGIDATLVDARSTARDLRELLAEATPRLRKLLDDLGPLPADARETLSEFKGLASGNRERIRGLIAKSTSAIESLQKTLDEVAGETKRVLGRVDDVVARNDRNLFLLMHHLRVAAEELKLAVARVRADPSQILFGGSEDPDAAEAAAKKSQERDLLDKGMLPPRWKR